MIDYFLLRNIAVIRWFVAICPLHGARTFHYNKDYNTLWPWEFVFTGARTLHYNKDYNFLGFT